jgi:hypothetical protein
VKIIDVVKRIAMIAAPIGLITFSLAHGTLSWPETRHLANAGRDEWIQHLTNIQGRWLAAHIGGVALFPLLGMTIWWMLPPRGLVSGVSKVALTVYVPLYIAVDGVLGIGSSILIHYREGLAPSDRAGVDGAFDALFFAPLLRNGRRSTDPRDPASRYRCEIRSSAEAVGSR